MERLDFFLTFFFLQTTSCSQITYIKIVRRSTVWMQIDSEQKIYNTIFNLF